MTAAGNCHAAATASTAALSTAAFPSMSSHGITLTPGSPAAWRAASTANSFAGNDAGTPPGVASAGSGAYPASVVFDRIVCTAGDVPTASTSAHCVPACSARPTLAQTSTRSMTSPASNPRTPTWYAPPWAFSPPARPSPVLWTTTTRPTACPSALAW